MAFTSENVDRDVILLRNLARMVRQARRTRFANTQAKERVVSSYETAFCAEMDRVRSLVQLTEGARAQAEALGALYDEIKSQ